MVILWFLRSLVCFVIIGGENEGLGLSSDLKIRYSCEKEVGFVFIIRGGGLYVCGRKFFEFVTKLLLYFVLMFIEI